MIDRPYAQAPGAEPPLNRGISPIAGAQRRRVGAVVVFGGLVVGCAALAAFGWTPGGTTPTPPPQQPARQVVAFEGLRPTLDQPGPDAPQLVPADPARPVPALDPQGTSLAASTPGGRSAQSDESVRRAPLLAYSRRVAVAAPDMIRPPAPQADEPTVKARRLGDRNYLILAGSSLPCVLQTAMDSTTPGPVTCVIPSDVHSDNGALVLLEKGTRVSGEYRTGLKRGQRRLHVLWTRAVTPNGIVLQLTSPAADALGRAGFDGEVDHHFWERFGAGLLLTVVDAGASGVTAALDTPGLVRLPSPAASTALEGGRDISPTLRKPQGSEVTIMAAHDFDFSEVYGLKAR
ncbi:type IV secretory pathway, VirB10 component [Phenylobacterium zucineum HLK1]|uniref:Type IV secretory pathway, VirB10 component n=1 Tax=Phenylobacterium zucineum (strain HLK1) TaxID=450851 RepID=B4RFV2_PHEZH|nr:TrbI/VirB10 family protein [Phenylobacterium zucineum]ACG78765.1 type IV secretory pathway, VirB10 component [Phenylobacterium zucineum HLK1]